VVLQAYSLHSGGETDKNRGGKLNLPKNSCSFSRVYGDSADPIRIKINL
jgi:hypothetical protein